MPDLIRASINFRNRLFQRGWITGSSPVMTISTGDDDLNWYDGSWQSGTLTTPAHC
jgi:hypothetical protein